MTQITAKMVDFEMLNHLGVALSCRPIPWRSLGADESFQSPQIAESQMDPYPCPLSGALLSGLSYQ